MLSALAGYHLLHFSTYSIRALGVCARRAALKVGPLLFLAGGLVIIRHITGGVLRGHYKEKERAREEHGEGCISFDEHHEIEQYRHTGSSKPRQSRKLKTPTHLKVLMMMMMMN